ncbi:hypothetical protein BDZ97DRAFT_1916962 [Flammula alnicola]|nr:hypothetical protein BDZ97DRAFT_1916962 [Flammula alnicola]
MVRLAFLFQQLPVLPSPDPTTFYDDSHVLAPPLQAFHLHCSMSSADATALGMRHIHQVIAMAITKY